MKGATTLPARGTDWRRALLQVTPLALPLAMLGVFALLPRLLGAVPGYFAGFCVWWAACFGLARLFGVQAPFAPPRALGRPLTWVLLGWALPITYALAFPRAVSHATLTVVLASAAIAAINGVAEETLWRGAFVSAFPGDRWRGVVWPALGFAAWHFAPQLVFENRFAGGSWSLVGFSLALGLAWGEALRRTRALWLVALFHVLLDFSGLGARLYFS